MLGGNAETSFGSKPFGHLLYCPPPTKRKSVIRLTGKVLNLSPSASSFTLSSMAGTDQDSIALPSIGANLNRELEPMAPWIILEPEEEEKEEIAPNMRVGFKKRQPKLLSESLLTTFSPTKRTCSEDLLRGPSRGVGPRCSFGADASI